MCEQGRDCGARAAANEWEPVAIDARRRCFRGPDCLCNLDPRPRSPVRLWQRVGDGARACALCIENDLVDPLEPADA